MSMEDDGTRRSPQEPGNQPEEQPEDQPLQLDWGAVHEDHADQPGNRAPEPAPAMPPAPAPAAPASQPFGTAWDAFNQPPVAPMPHYGQPLGGTGHPFRVGTVLSRSLSIYLHKLVAFNLIALLLYVPMFLYTRSVLSGGIDESAVESWEKVLTWGTMPFSWFISSFIVWGTFQDLRGQPAALGTMLRMGLRRFGRVLGVSVALGLALIAVLLIGFLASVVIGFVFTPLAFLGLIGMGVLLAMLWTRWWVIVPAVVVESVPIFESFKRSDDLTEGYRWQIFGIAVLLFLAGFGTVLLLDLMLLRGYVSDTDVAVYLYGRVVISMIATTAGAVFTAVSYYELRSSKEHVDLDQLVDIFA